MESSHRIEEAEVFDRNGNPLYIGPAHKAVEWVLDNPLYPHTVKLEDTKNPMSIDDWLREYDTLEEFLGES